MLECVKFPRIDKVSTALALPKIATYNMRSLMPKLESLKTDIIERSIDIAFLQEIWENSDSESHQAKIEKMFQIHGLKYISKPRPLSKRGYAYGGAAIIIDISKFHYKELSIVMSSSIEVVWGLAKPKSEVA